MKFKTRGSSNSNFSSRQPLLLNIGDAELNELSPTHDDVEHVAIRDLQQLQRITISQLVRSVFGNAQQHHTCNHKKSSIRGNECKAAATLCGDARILLLDH